VASPSEKEALEKVGALIAAEVNVKSIKWVMDDEGIFVKSMKPDFKVLGPKYGKLMKPLSVVIAAANQADIAAMEQSGAWQVVVDGQTITLTPEDVEIVTKDIPGWLVMHEQGRTVALDIQLNEALIAEGLTRELVNRIQNHRKESGLDVTDRIEITLQEDALLKAALSAHETYLLAETLGTAVHWQPHVPDGMPLEFDGVTTAIKINKV
jgi:isoleucyl-tRNA synthetase